MLYADAKRDDNIRRFTQDLDKLIYDMRFKVIAIKERVGDEVVKTLTKFFSCQLELKKTCLPC